MNPTDVPHPASAPAVTDAEDVIDLTQVDSPPRSAAEGVALAEAGRAHRARLDLLAHVNDVLVTARDEAAVLLGTVTAVVPRLGDWCALYIRDQDDPAWFSSFDVAHVDPAVTARARMHIEESRFEPDELWGVSRVLREGVISRWEADRPAVTEQMVTEQVVTEQMVTEQMVAGLDGLGLSSVVTLPLSRHGRILGVLQLGRVRRTFTDEDVSLAVAAAGRLASSIEVRRLVEREHEIARALQASLLPDHLPEVAGLDMAVRYWPAGESTEVGGDFYDVFRVADGTWGALIGDVCGTGPSAAALTGLARHSTRMSAWNGNDPVETIRWLNRAVHEAGSDTFLTAAYLTLEPGAGGVEVNAASGGHPRPIVVRGDGSLADLPASGTLLGPFAEVSLDPAELHLDAGDTLILYTDGVTDLPDPHGLSEEDLGAMAVEAARRSDAEGVADHLHEQIEGVLPLTSRRDDIALLVVRATGEVGEVHGLGEAGKPR